MRSRPLVKPAAGSVTRIVQRRGHRTALAQAAFEGCHAAEIGVGPRRDSGGRLEAPLQMERAQAQLAAERVECYGLIQMLFEIPAYIFHQLRLGIARALPLGLAAQAGAKAGPLRRIAALEEEHVLWPGPPRRA